MGLAKKKLVDVDAVSDALDSDDEAARAQSVADRALTLVRNQGGVIPLATPNQACLVVSSGIRLSTFGQRLAAEFRQRAPLYYLHCLRGSTMRYHSRRWTR